VIRLRDAGVESNLLDSQLMMARALECSRLSVITHPEIELTDEQLNAFRSMLERRIQRYPLAYLIGRREFYGLDLIVREGVLVPRPETEVLVEECIKRLGRGPRVVADIGLGSGAIAVALAVNMPEAKIYGTEVSAEALEVARENVARHHVADRVCILPGNLLEPLMDLGARFDAVVSNPPYIPTGDILSLEPEVRVYEPLKALDGGADGLDIYRVLIPGAVDCLGDEGFVAVEIGIGQADSVIQIARGSGYAHVEVIRDLAGIERVLIISR